MPTLFNISLSEEEKKISLKDYFYEKKKNLIWRIVVLLSFMIIANIQIWIKC